MQTFRYEAADAQGRIETGTLEADSQRGALGQLRARGLTPLEVREQAGGGTGQGAGALFAPAPVRRRPGLGHPPAGQPAGR